jgi:hypothetical protein
VNEKPHSTPGARIKGSQALRSRIKGAVHDLRELHQTGVAKSIQCPRTVPAPGNNPLG